MRYSLKLLWVGLVLTGVLGGALLLKWADERRGADEVAGDDAAEVVPAVRDIPGTNPVPAPRAAAGRQSADIPAPRTGPDRRGFPDFFGDAPVIEEHWQPGYEPGTIRHQRLVAHEGR